MNRLTHAPKPPVKTASAGLTPKYGGFDGTSAAAVAARRNQLSQLVGDAKTAADSVPVRIEADCSMRVAELTPLQTVALPLGPGRQAYLLCVEGAVAASDGNGGDASGARRLVRHDAAEVRGEGELRLTSGEEGAHVLLMEMAAGGGGRAPGKWPLHM